MKKFLITIFLSGCAALVVAALIHINPRVDTQDMVTHQVLDQEPVVMKLTKSQKIEQKYHSPVDPVGDIPVVFEQIVLADEECQFDKNKPYPPAGNCGERTSSFESFYPNVLPNSYSDSHAYQAYSQDAGFDPHMYPEYHYDVPKAHNAQSPKQIASNVSKNANTIGQKYAQPVENNRDQISDDFVHDTLKEPELYDFSVKPQYMPSSNNITEQVNYDPEKMSDVKPDPSESWYKKFKRLFSYIPKWLSVIPLAAGAYALKDQPIGSLVKVNPILPEYPETLEPLSKSDVDITDPAASVIREGIDRHMTEQQSSQQQNPKHEAEHYTQSANNDIEQSQSKMNASDELDNTKKNSLPSSTVGPKSGLFGATPTLKNMHSRGQIETSTLINAVSEVSTEAQASAFVEAKSAVETGIKSNSMSLWFANHYRNIAKSCNSPVGILSLATRTVALAIKALPFVSAMRQSSNALALEPNIDMAIKNVMSKIPPIQPASAAIIQSVSSSGFSQLTAGNVAVVAGQLAGQCAKLAIR